MPEISQRGGKWVTIKVKVGIFGEAAIFTQFKLTISESYGCRDCSPQNAPGLLSKVLKM